MTHRVHHRSAFAAATAITLLALVGVVLAALATGFSLDVKRSRAASQEAQLRQMLLAGASVAIDRLDRDPTPARFDVPLPRALADGSRLSITLRIDDTTGVAVAHVQATLAERTAAQRLTLQRSASTWQTTGVTVN